MRIESKEAEFEGILNAARLMAIAIRTAPKANGIDSIETLILSGEEKNSLADKLEDLGKEKGGGWIKFYGRDAENLRNSDAVILVGIYGGRSPAPLMCGACGMDCKQLLKSERVTKDFTGPNCMMKILDLGVALGSAVKLAAELNVDNRIMYSVGVAAKKLGLMDTDVIISIPVSATGKNIFFDRGREHPEKK
ncbi:MAG: ferredoxin domain-containing protein [Candidatus Hydrothermarchaeota archaeon]